MAEITLSGLAHSYLSRPASRADYALKALDLTFADGGAYALLGPSGCGKTSLLNIVSGLVSPTEGRVLLGGRDVTVLATEKRNIAQVFQFPVIYDTMSVYENLAFPLRNRRLPAGAIDRRVHDVAAMLDLSGLLTRRASGLTADLKQKISLGRGLVRADVGAILFDEPLTVIDPHLKWLLRGQLKKIHQDARVTMIYVTHDQTEALTFADTVVVMYDGEVVQVGTPQDLFERPAHTFVGYFIGSPGMNVLPAEISGTMARVGDVTLALGARFAAPPAGARVEIGVRPEFLRLAAGPEGLPVRVRRIEDIGRNLILRGMLGSHPVSVLLPEGAAVRDDMVLLTADPAHVHVYVDGHRVEPVHG